MERTPFKNKPFSGKVSRKAKSLTCVSLRILLFTSKTPRLVLIRKTLRRSSEKNIQNLSSKSGGERAHMISQVCYCYYRKENVHKLC